MRRLGWITLLVLVVTSVGCQATRSSYSCTGTSAEDRTCEFRDICVSGDGKAWEFFTGGDGDSDSDSDTTHPPLSAADTAFLAGPIAALGPGAKAPRFQVRVVPGPVPTTTTGTDLMQQRTAALFCASAKTSYPQWLLDDLFSLHWLVAHHSPSGSARTARRTLDVVHSCARRSNFADAFEGLLSTTTPTATAAIKGKCYARVLVGTAGRALLSNPSAVTPQDIAAFRADLWDAAGAKERATGKAILVQRRSPPLITNAADLYDAVGAKSSAAELAFYENMPFGGQVASAATASVLIGARGGALSNMVFMEPGTAVVEIMPYGYSDDWSKDLAAKLGLVYERWTLEDRSGATFHEGALDRYGIYGDVREAVMKAQKWDPSTMPATAKAYWADQDVKVDCEAVATIASKYAKAPQQEL